MRVLIAYYTRTGYTGTLAQRIAEELKSRGHEIVFERIEVARQKSRWNLFFRQICQYPLVELCLLSSSFRRWWLKHYIQEVFEIELIFKPMSDGIQALGGTLIAALGLSSSYHELGVLPIFKRVTPSTLYLLYRGMLERCSGLISAR